jgi:hypothetical protein
MVSAWYKHVDKTSMHAHRYKLISWENENKSEDLYVVPVEKERGGWNLLLNPGMKMEAVSSERIFWSRSWAWKKRKNGKSNKYNLINYKAEGPVLSNILLEYPLMPFPQFNLHKFPHFCVLSFLELWEAPVKTFDIFLKKSVLFKNLFFNIFFIILMY